MAPVKDTFCSFCGAAYKEPLAYPRTCPSCKVTIWSNPTPVCVVLVPVTSAGRTGLLVVRRGIEPGLGKLALVGGFLEDHETWQSGAAREVREETGVAVGAPEPFWYASSSPKPNRVLLFSTVPVLDARSIAPFTPNHETQERGLVFGPGGLDAVFAFSLHAEAARRWFSRHDLSGDHAFSSV
jgi:ADP-ribose pyrophosphatase YjhB (NUDIX family)